MPAEFDRYARNYEELLQDPIRDRFAKSNDFFHRRKWMLIERFIQRQGFAAAKSSWLDVGCGKGELLSAGRASFGRAVGCDPSEEMARAAGDEVRLQPAPDVLPFEDQSFDFVSAVCVYHHVEERSRIPLTREIHRVLRPAGVFCIIEHNPLNPVTRMIVQRTPVDAGAHLLSSRHAQRYVRVAGFHVMSSEFFLYLPESFYDRARIVESALKRLPFGGQYAIFSKRM
jgi:SAM-dependent methyltransferase